MRENILYGKLDATDEEMIAAAKAVNAHEFIMKMEKGYDTELKEHGAGLSIGQRQLIAFARTMILDAEDSDSWMRQRPVLIHTPRFLCKRELRHCCPAEPVS